MDFTNIDVDSLVKHTKVAVTIFLGVRKRKTCFVPSE